MTARPSVVFVGHDASRTGAPVALGHALRWADAHTGAALQVVLLDGGPLVDSYRAVAPTILLGGRATDAVRALAAGARSVGAPAPRRVPLAGMRRVPPADVVVANTLASLGVAARLADRGPSRARLVAYVHELDGVATRVLPADAVSRAASLARVDAFAAVGEAVATMLVDRMGVPATRVHVVDGCIEAPPPGGPDPALGRELLGVTDERPALLSVGALHRRKGPERFVDLMTLLSSHPSAPQGRWLGGVAGSSVDQEVRSDIARSADPAAVRLVAPVASPWACFSAADLVVSTAIEDPFPLSVLEAGAAGVPVVGFDSGGLRAVLAGADQEDAVVPVGDLLGLAAVVTRLLDDPASRARRGERLSRWVQRRHLVDQVLPSLWSVVAP